VRLVIEQARFRAETIASLKRKLPYPVTALPPQFEQTLQGILDRQKW
jgi:hypothetical protein